MSLQGGGGRCNQKSNWKRREVKVQVERKNITWKDEFWVREEIVK